MNEFSCIGLDIENSDQMYDFVGSHDYLTKFYEKDGKTFLRLICGRLTELWFYQHDESGLIDTSNPCIFHKSRFMVPIEAVDILSDAPYGPVLMNVNCINGKIDFPLNVCISDGYLIDDFEKLEFTGAAIAMIARELFIFEDEDDYYDQIGITGLGAECFVPTGMLPENVNKMDEFVPSATALVCGTVMDSRFEVNEVTGNRYIIIGIECLGYMFDVVACEGLMMDQSELLSKYENGLPKKGNILSGRYWLTGKVFK